MPPVNVGLLEGALAWRQRDSGHTDTPNIEHFIKWVEWHRHISAEEKDAGDR